MRLPLVTLAAAAALAPAAGAQSADRIDALLAAVEADGCIVHEGNEKQILATTGLTEAEGSRIVMILMSDGRAVPHGDDLRVTTGKCK